MSAPIEYNSRAWRNIFYSEPQQRKVMFQGNRGMPCTCQKTNEFVIANEVKLVIFVPVGPAADKVREIMGRGGADKVGDYSHGSFSTTGTVQFKEMKNREVRSYQSVDKAVEERIETIVPRELLHRLLRDIKAVHPYKEMGYDVYPLYAIPKASL